MSAESDEWFGLHRTVTFTEGSIMTDWMLALLMLTPCNQPNALDAVNLNRSKPVVNDKQLYRLAQEKSAHSILLKRLEHNPTDLRSRLVGGDYKFQVAGENLAIGSSNVYDIIEAWKESPSHKATLEDPRYEKGGIACLTKDNSTFFWTMILAK